MLEVLAAASDALCVALEGYTSICLDIQRSYARGEKLHMINPQLPQRIEAEAKLAASLEVKLRKAIAAISWSRNQSNTRVTINSLPSELLARIFHIVHGMQPCAKGGHDYYKRREVGPASPTALSLVCSRWREITFSTPTLWSHIDLSTSTLLNQKRLDCLAELHLDRAGPLPLYLHIFESYAYHTKWKICESLKRSVTQIASRVVSFELDVRDFMSLDHFYRELISTFFNNCTPGKLTQLALVMPRPDYHVTLMCQDYFYTNVALGISTEQLEDILSHVSILRLSQLYFPWNSRAYHGLVELRLSGCRGAISEQELIDILRFSPDLRIIQLTMSLLDPLPADSQIRPISLNNLEVLNVSIHHQAGTILRWLAPSSKPLTFAVSTYAEDLQLKGESFRLFFSRACITRAYERWMQPSNIIDLLDLTPNLQEMAVEIEEYRGPSQWETDELSSERRLECLHLVSCRVYIETIIAFMNIPSLTIKKLSFYRCHLRVDNIWIPVDRVPHYIAEIVRMYPGVNFIIEDPNEPSPIESWRLFEWYQPDDD